VRHDDERLVPALQVRLEPEHGVQVEVVGRLVEQQHVRRDEERAGEGDAHPPPAGEGAGWPCLHLRVEA